MKQVITLPSITDYILALEDNKLYYKVTNAGDETYIPISSDLSDYYTKLECNDLLDNKDNTLQYIERGTFLLSSNTFCYATRSTW